MHLRNTNNAISKLILVILVLVVYIFFPRQLTCRETGFKYFKNYTYKEYDHQPQNWDLVQAENGIIYVANQGGVLEFDGETWRVIKVPDYAPVYSISNDEKGTLYVGGVNRIGYLSLGAGNSLKYISLLSHLDDKYKNFSKVFRTHSVKEGVYFRTLKFLFRWKTGKLKVWQSSYIFINSFVCNGNLYIQEIGKGLMQIKSDSLKLVSGGERFAKIHIYFMVPYDSGLPGGKILLGTRLRGFFLYDGIKSVPFPTEVDDYLKKNQLNHGIRLTSGDFALATARGGMIIIDHDGNLKYAFDKKLGLQNNRVRFLKEDVQGNIWMALSKGISKIEYSSPFFLYDDKLELPSFPQSVVQHQNDLYVGTDQGIYVLDSPSNRFQHVQNITYNCRHLLSYKNSLFAATSRGVYYIQQNDRQRLIREHSYALLPSRQYPGHIWCGSSHGLILLGRPNGRWKEVKRFPTIKKSIQFIGEDPEGHLWLSLLKGGISKVDFTMGIEHPVVTHLGSSQGLPEGSVYITMAAGHFMFATQKGIFRFDEKEKRFVPDVTLGENFKGGTQPVFRIVEDKNKHIWIHSQSVNYQAVPRQGKSYTINSEPFRRLPAIQVNQIYPAHTRNTVWFASYDGLIRYDTKVKKKYHRDFRTLIRRVLVNEKPIYNGSKNLVESGNRSMTQIAFKDRNLYFEFAAPFFEDEERIQYQWILEGYEDDWSDWTLESHSAYYDLRPGTYTYRVKAKNVYQHLGQEDGFRFIILRPWYRTWWAFLVYALLFLTMTFLVAKWRHSIKLERERKKLERIVIERTKEVNEKNRQLVKKSSQLKDLNKMKSRFFANISHEFRTPLTLIMSPLEQMIDESDRKEQRKKLRIMLRNSKRLLILINQLLDLSRFDSGNVKLQAACQNIVPFIKGILASFHMLANQNGMSLEFESEKEDIPLYFDAGKMENVMYNLLINAFKFTPPGGKIMISVAIDTENRQAQQHSLDDANLPPGFVKISVRDTGVGISNEQLPHIFDRFYQSQNRLKGKGPKGTGIGLALTKEIVNLHQGKIDVHSLEGKGTEFVVLLPIGHTHLKAEEISFHLQTVPSKEREKEKRMETLFLSSEMEMEWDEDEMQKDYERESRKNFDDASKEKHGLRKKNVILVVEDHADVRKYIRETLEPYFDVVEASGGKIGIQKAKSMIPDLIVSDIMMPDLDGYQLCRTLKRDFNTSHIPIILLTAKASEKSTIRGLEKGADDYITKPFNTRILLTRIKNLIELRRQIQLKIQRSQMLLPNEISVSSQDEIFLKKVRDTIEKKLSDPDFNIDALCQILNLGRSTLFRKLHALTGETPNQFILSYRLERGAKLLKENFGNITEIALAVGFSTSAYFSKCFRDKFQQSPSSFKASEGFGWNASGGHQG